MNEEVPSGQQPNEPPLTYHDLLEQSDLHPGIAAHIERLAAEQSPTPEQSQSPGLVEITAQITQAAHQAESVTTLPESDIELFGASAEAIQEALDHASSSSELFAFIQQSAAMGEATERRLNRLYGTIYQPPADLYAETLRFLHKAPPDLLREVYNDPEKSPLLKTMIETASEPRQINATLILFQEIYDLDDALDLVDQAAHDPTVATLLNKPGVANALTYTLFQENPNWPRGMDAKLASVHRRDWGERFLEKFGGLPKELREELIFDSTSRVLRTDKGREDELDVAKWSALLEVAAENARHLGPDKLTLLRERAGIVNLDYYPPEQLDSMVDFVNGDERMLRHLRAGDVTVVFIDGKGDYNGASKNTAEQFATPNNRTLTFELNEPRDFYRHMQLLKRLGVKPSTMVTSTHGMPGVMGFGDNGFYMVNEYFAEGEDWPRNYGSILDAKGLARAVNEFMQDSRGRDDNPEAAGRRRIFLCSCDLASLSPVRRPNKSTAKRVKHGEMYVAAESVAESLARLLRNPDVDIYGADAPIYLEKTETGVHAYTSVLLPEGGTLKEKVYPLVTKIDERGMLVQARLETVTLRRGLNINEEEDAA
jgi:hypothetical protein